MKISESAQMGALCLLECWILFVNASGLGEGQGHVVENMVVFVPTGRYEYCPSLCKVAENIS